MSDQEIADFERQLESDPSLKAESDFQSDIVSGLKEHRKLELKSRLDAINVGPTWMEFAQQSTLVKSLGGVIVASLVGTGIYFMADKPENSEEQTAIPVDAPIAQSTEYVLDLGKVDEEIKSNELETPEELNDVSRNEAVKETPQKEDQPSESITTEEEESKPNETFKPSFEAPTIENVDEEKQFAASDLDELPDDATIANEDPVDVTHENSNSSTIRYKYYDGKLFLKGDFDKAPYEILEINSAAGRRIYVFYLGSYYKVGVTDRLTELPIVRDSKVVEELNLLRENK
ncbi:MAG: hypothetical protein RLN88_02920 [Ekhidna sp.]